MEGEKFSSIQDANMWLIYWSVRSSSSRGGDGLKSVDGGYRYLASCVFHFIREHENLV